MLTEINNQSKIDRTRTSLCKQISKQPDFLAIGADLIDRRGNNSRNIILFDVSFGKLFKVALYTDGSTIYKPTSQYSDLDIL